MALCLLADPWARRRGGRLVALTVDHGLRPGSAAEAKRAGSWLARRGIAHQVLRWRGEKPSRGVQAAARQARYRLLHRWCARHGALHLLLAHHLEDQAETFLMRLARGSGVDGLAAMAPLGGDQGILHLRPLLGTAKARLAATLRQHKQPWIEDPSNRDPAFERVRVRRARGALETLGMSAPRLAGTARHMARARAALEAEVDDLLARSVGVHAAGFCLVDPGVLAAAAPEISLRALSRVLQCVAGTEYPPRFERLARLGEALAAGLGSARTLSGCRIVPWDGRILVCREAAAAAAPLPLTAGAPGRWDARFTVGVSVSGQAPRRGLAVARLGLAGWRQIVTARAALGETALPAPARTVLPALWRSGRVLSVPHLGFDRSPAGGRSRLRFSARFQPPRPLSVGSFAVAIAQPAPMY
jgi:tRNA(Ile)-lysidine synthase